MAANRLFPAPRLLVVFVATIFVPGLLLAAFGVRALWQERRVAEGELRDRLERGNEAAIRVLADDLAKLQAVVDERSVDDRLFRAFPTDGSWVYVDDQGGHRLAYPTGALPYDLGPPVERVSTAPGPLDLKHRQARALRQAG